VVEDEPLVAGILDAWLAATGDYEVLVAHSGGEALARCGERAPALVLLDLELPDMDGAELLGRLRDRFADVPAVACTGRRPEADAGAVFSAFFRKPLDMRALTREVRRLLRTQPLGAAKENC